MNEEQEYWYNCGKHDGFIEGTMKYLEMYFEKQRMEIFMVFAIPAKDLGLTPRDSYWHGIRASGFYREGKE